MKKEELLTLGVDEEVVKKILEINGKDIEKHKTLTDKEKENAEKLATELEGVKTQLAGANEQIQSFEKMDIEGIKNSVKEWETKYQTDTEALKTQMQEKDYSSAIDKYLGQHEFISEFSKKAFINEFKAKEFKLENDKFLGADDFIKEFKEANQGVFKVEEVKEANPTEIPQVQPTYTYTPNGGGSQVDLATQARNAVMGL